MEDMEDTPVEGIEQWNFPEQYLKELQTLEHNSSYFNIVQGRLYEEMRRDARYTPCEALDVTTHLNTGNIDEAIEAIDENLEYDIREEL